MKIVSVIMAGVMCSIFATSSRAAEQQAPVSATPAAPKVESATKPSLWISNFESAKAKAASEGKDILIDFTGSDWCGWCIKLKKEVFSTPEFESAAPALFILMEADFPRDKSKLTPDVIAQNQRLQENFGVRGFPTIILMDPQGRPYARAGYQEGGPAKYLETLKAAQAVRTKRDAAWEKAESAKGVDKAKALAEGLAVLDEDIVAAHYGSVIDDIKKLDPQDSSGIVKKVEYKAKLSGLEKSVGETYAKTRDADAAAKLIDDFMTINKVTGAERQKAMMLKLQLYPPRTVENVNKALALLDAVVAIDAQSDTGTQAAGIKPQAEMFKKRLEANRAKPELKAEKNPAAAK